MEARRKDRWADGASIHLAPEVAFDPERAQLVRLPSKELIARLSDERAKRNPRPPPPPRSSIDRMLLLVVLLAIFAMEVARAVRV